VVAAEAAADILEIGAIGGLGEPHQVHDQDADDLPLLAGGCRGGRHGFPHSRQNFARSGFASPHAGQLDTRRV
jgi:hypothetical protein